MKSRSAYFVALFVLGSSFALDNVTYTNFIRPGPIEINVITIPRRASSLEFQSIHSGGKPVGRSPLTEQLKLLKSGSPIAAINGDFFQLEGPFAGDPRGLQIVNGAIISAPANTASFWLDSSGAPHLGITKSQLRITWPNGSTAPLALNENCDNNEIVLYTPDVDFSRAHSDNVAREIVLVPTNNETNPVLHAGNVYSFTVHELPEPAGSFRLALGTTVAPNAPPLQSGAIVKISTAITPNLRNATTAISGGPLLIISGEQQRFDKPSTTLSPSKPSFTLEKHPRTALGWSNKEFFWVEVDGRRKDSVGMNLNELGAFMIELGCTEAVNLDGGGSSTIWFEGKVRNHPSDGAERPVANSLILVRKMDPTP
jgi:hypothetical protein